MTKVKDQKDLVAEARESLEYSKVAIAAVTFIIIGATFYHYVEKFAWLDSFYFTTITLATVGYGDFVPKTDAGKIFTIFYVLIGITIFIALARIVLGSLVLRNRNKR